MKKNQVLKVIFVLICTIGFVLSAAPVFSETTVLRWSQPGPKRGYATEWLDWVSKEIESRTDGRVKIDQYWAGSLSNMKEMPEAVKSGMADIGWISSAYHTGYGELTGFSHPMDLFNPERDPVKYMEKWYQIMDSMPEIYEEFKEENMYPISCIYYDEYWIFSNKPIRSLEDFKGLKIRVISEPRQIAMKAVGASPVFIPSGEMYSAVEKGIIDALGWSPDVARRYNIHEVTKYITKINFMPGVAYWCMNLDTFENLSESDQKAILEVCREADIKMAEFLGKERERALQTFKEAGLEVFDFAEDDKEKMRSLPEFKEYSRKWVTEKEEKGLPAR
ncbi:MAG: TRAP transporter substrate-binding protein, partial [Desulfobacterales bacterium]